MANCLLPIPASTARSSPLKPAMATGLPRSKFLEVAGFNLGRVVTVRKPEGAKHTSIRAKAADSDQRTKPNSIVCVDCEGNGVVVCSQCKGSGVNSVDHFNGRFKAGGLCWLCRGKKEILCGNCNGAGFVGGFMSSYDD
ncbi:hypothetical protein EJ110_NYTH21439 [Nymphaea thermarum]|nr:hypothetical protein EJ110_NYTH21439 [Nymphaea thermarum]